MMRGESARHVDTGSPRGGYGEHAYDLAWGGLSGQITRKVVADFPARYLPPVARP
jgi:hypothetical protein